MELRDKYDVGIAGGGLAGLAASILLARQGHAVALFEKEEYPYHKVCGEYVSLESWDFLERLGLPLSDWNLPIIKTLQLTAPNGTAFTTALPLGGFGISRYKMDDALAQLAVTNGVHLFTSAKVNDVARAEEAFTVQSSKGVTTATVACAAFGKRSNLDIKWSRPFAQGPANRLNNYVGIKYHLKTVWPPDVIGLHNFKDGYCGISKIEDSTYCCCYMTTAVNLQRAGSIEALQQTVLSKNPHLKRIFTESEPLEPFPVTISQISFASKSRTENGVLMLGDAAGMITPLCGNGISIALHTAKLAADAVDAFLRCRITRGEMETAYDRVWNRHFARRLRTGRMLQRFFGAEGLSNAFVGAFKAAPSLARPLIRQTHGRPF